MARTAQVEPQRTTVCFVRHGTTPTTGQILPGRARGLHLSPLGIEEALRAGERLKVLGQIAAMYTSPLERARETAREIARSIGKRATTDRGLLECDFGSWTGLKLVDLRKLPEWPIVLNSPSSFRFPSGESFLELRARITAAVGKIVERHLGGLVVAVSHADPIKVAISDALGAPLDLMQRTVISPCSISVVSYGDGAPVVLCVNSMGDLASLGPSRHRQIGTKESSTDQ